MLFTTLIQVDTKRKVMVNDSGSAGAYRWWMNGQRLENGMILSLSPGVCRINLHALIGETNHGDVFGLFHDLWIYP